MQLHDNIIQYREGKNLSQDNMADLLGMTQPNYSKLERKVIKDPMLLRIATALKTTPDSLRNYHLPPKQVSTPDDYRAQLLCQKDETIRVLQEQVHHLEANADLRERLAGYLQGGVNEPVTATTSTLPIPSMFGASTTNPGTLPKMA